MRGVGAALASTWCAACGSSHASPKDCPGDLRATGPERHGWRVAVETPHGIEAYGILVAPAHAKWRARVLTYPNVLWTIPGGQSTLKFVADTPQAAEAAAASFIEGHIQARGYARRIGSDTPESGRYRAEARPGALAASGPLLRKNRALPVRFGSGPTQFAAMTGNLSESGLFVVTLAPLAPGEDLRVAMEIDTGPLGLKGEVVWARRRFVLGRPVGMGVQLVAPPEAYRRFVRELP